MKRIGLVLAACVAMILAPAIQAGGVDSGTSARAATGSSYTPVRGAGRQGYSEPLRQEQSNTNQSRAAWRYGHIPYYGHGSGRNFEQRRKIRERQARPRSHVIW